MPTEQQISALKELQSRRANLSPEKVSALDELSKRWNVSSESMSSTIKTDPNSDFQPEGQQVNTVDNSGLSRREYGQMGRAKNFLDETQTGIKPVAQDFLKAGANIAKSDPIGYVQMANTMFEAGGLVPKLVTDFLKNQEDPIDKFAGKSIEEVLHTFGKVSNFLNDLNPVKALVNKIGEEYPEAKPYVDEFNRTHQNASMLVLGSLVGSPVKSVKGVAKSTLEIAPKSVGEYLHGAAEGWMATAIPSGLAKTVEGVRDISRRTLDARMTYTKEGAIAGDAVMAKSTSELMNKVIDPATTAGQKFFDGQTILDNLVVEKNKVTGKLTTKPTETKAFNYVAGRIQYYMDAYGVNSRYLDPKVVQIMKQDIQSQMNDFFKSRQLLKGISRKETALEKAWKSPEATTRSMLETLGVGVKDINKQSSMLNQVVRDIKDYNVKKFQGRADGAENLKVKLSTGGKPGLLSYFPLLKSTRFRSRLALALDDMGRVITKKPSTLIMEIDPYVPQPIPPSAGGLPPIGGTSVPPVIPSGGSSTAIQTVGGGSVNPPPFQQTPQAAVFKELKGTVPQKQISNSSSSINAYSNSDPLIELRDSYENARGMTRSSAAHELFRRGELSAEEFSREYPALYKKEIAVSELSNRIKEVKGIKLPDMNKYSSPTERLLELDAQVMQAIDKSDNTTANLAKKQGISIALAKRAASEWYDAMLGRESRADGVKRTLDEVRELYPYGEEAGKALKEAHDIGGRVQPEFTLIQLAQQLVKEGRASTFKEAVKLYKDAQELINSGKETNFDSAVKSVKQSQSGLSKK